MKFYWKVDSEADFDYLLFCVDNDSCTRTSGFEQRISGTTSWAEVTHAVSAGSHSFRWLYAKDGSVAEGADAGWVDNIRFITTGGTGEASIWADDRDAEGTSNANMSTVTTKAIRMAASPAGGAIATTTAEADMNSFDPTGFTLGWTTTDATARQVLYWAVGSVTASQEDYRWYRNANSLTPGSALEDENQSTIVAKNKPDVRLRANLSVGGNGLNADTQGYKLQYAANQAEAAVGGTSDWCNDTTGITCTAPVQGEIPASTPTDWCNDTTGVTCDSNWQYRKKITFDNSDSTTNLANFAVLVKLDATRIDYTKTQNAGQDIRFVDPADPTIVLSHEIELWNESGSSYVWVEVPQLDARSTTDGVWMYYGNASVGDGQDVAGTWDSNTALVQHLEEPLACGDGGFTGFSDSTSPANNGTCSGGGPAVNATGKIGGARTFDGTNDLISIPDDAVFEPGSGSQTIEAWINTNSATQDQAIMDHATWSFFMNSSFDGCAVGRICYWDGANETGVTSGITANTWHHVAVVKSGTTATFYLNGASIGSTTVAGTIGGSLDPVSIGSSPFGGGLEFNGSIDELRYSQTNRSTDWIRANYLTQNDQMNAFGSEFSYAETQQSSTGWQYRRKITFDNSASTENLTNFPVLVKLDNSKIDYNKTKDNGADIRFVDPSDRTTVLSHEIESWDENGTSYVWVKVPQIDSGSTSDYIWMYYGNPGASDGQDVAGVWDSSHRGVWNLKEDPTSTAPQMQDSTANNNDGTAGGTWTSGQQIRGKVNGSLDHDNPSSNRVHVNGVADDIATGDVTYSLWFNPAQTFSAGAGGDHYLFSLSDSPSQNEVRLSLVRSTGAASFTVMNTCTPTVANAVTSQTSWTGGTWYHVVGVFSSTTGQKIYINGVESGSNSNTTRCASPASVNAQIGAFVNGTSGFFDGIIDSVRVSNSARSAEWIEAEYLTTNDQMNSFGQEQPFTTSGNMASSGGWIDVADVWCNDAVGVTCNTSWNNRKRITIDNSSSSTNLTNFPILVKLDSTRIDYSKTQNSGQDLRFVDPSDPTVVLSHEIETWNESGESFVWVEVPLLEAGSTIESIWMYYGNASVGDGQDTAGTWDSNYALVQHLEETAACNTTFTDSTSPANNGSCNGGGPAVNSAGKINGARTFDNVDDYISIPDDAVFEPGSGSQTIEAWINTTSATQHQPIVAHQTGSTGWIFELNRASGTCAVGRICYNDSSNSFGVVSGITANTWTHIAVVKSGTTATFYVNGASVGSDTVAGTIADAAGIVRIGGDDFNRDFAGSMDEVRYSQTNRSAEWIKANYLTQSDQMNTFGAEETQTSSVWRFKHNAAVADGTTLPSGVLGTSATGNQMTYQEANPTTLNPSSLAVGEKREFDFSLDGTNTSARRTYYFRLVTADGEPLTNYTRYPSITVGVPNQKVMRGGKFFNYKQAQPLTF